LIAMLNDQDWLLNESAAKAIGAVGAARPDAIAALEHVNRSHWSALVRKAADEALVALHARPAPPPAPPPAPSSGPETLHIGRGPQPFDHGLPWCDPKGRTSIDGRHWFPVDWKEADFQPVPKNFPVAAGMPQKGTGTRVFLRVPDGWLFGADGFEHEGLFLHVSNTGRITELDTGVEGHAFSELREGRAVINTILRAGKKYLALGYETLRSGDAGVLYEIARDQGGHWRATRKLVLPGIAQRHAFAPDGTLLMSDTANSWAVAHGEVVPLQCSRTFEGSYFREGVRQNYH
jgi:hypothetical protein